MSHNSPAPNSSDSVHVLPRPEQVDRLNGVFQLNRDTSIVRNTDKTQVRQLIDRFIDRLNSATWHTHSSTLRNNDSTEKNEIRILLDPNNKTVDDEEGYLLSVEPDTVELRATTPAGLFYGVQTLRQLLPPALETSDPTLVPQDTDWTIPAVRITDHPRFHYRGMHLDVGRHLFPVSFIKKYIDLLAYHKMNRFHWHLTEDQGWRIEIEQYPKLTEVGAWRDETLIGHLNDEPHRYDGRQYGGFYTQEEIREVVEYAQDRFVTVIPEIDMPGHSSAALAAYPEYGCKKNGNYDVKTSWGIKENVYCPSEKTFTFLENVLGEVMDLFPTKHIHIGGDEAKKTQWKDSELAQKVMRERNLDSEKELQSYFIQRIASYLNEHDRRIIGWDEIMEGGLAEGATVMSWRGFDGGIKAANQNHDVIMTPTSHCYFDYYQADPDTEPLAIGGLTSLRTVYDFDPIPDELRGTDKAKFVIGSQGNVWTEYVKSPDKVEYMAYPRGAALAEVVWSPADRRDWSDFWHRLQTHFKRFDRLDVNAAEHYRGQQPTFGDEDE